MPATRASVLAFYDYDLLLGLSWAGHENFREMFTTDRVFRAALFNTVYFTAVGVPLSVVLGLATAMLVNQALRGVVHFRSIFLLPYVTVTVALSHESLGAPLTVGGEGVLYFAAPHFGAYRDHDY
jgi:multiple sugar transport system permease protein